MPTDAEEIRAAFDELTADPVDTGQLLSSVRSAERRRRLVLAGSAVGLVAITAIAVPSFTGAPDRIRTIPAESPEMSFCETRRETVVRRDYEHVIDATRYELRLPVPLPVGACLSNVEYAVGSSTPPLIISVNMWFDWEGSRISVRQQERSAVVEELGEPVVINGRTWLRRESSSAVPGSNSRGGTIYFMHRFDDGVIVAVSSTSQAERFAQTFAELLTHSLRADEGETHGRAACDAAADRYNQGDPLLAARTREARPTTAGNIARWLSDKGQVNNHWFDKPPEQKFTVCLLDGDFSRIPFPGPPGAPRDKAELVLVVGDTDTMLMAGRAGTLSLAGLQPFPSSSPEGTPSRCFLQRLELSPTRVRAGDTVRVSSRPAQCMPYAEGTTYRALLLFVGRADPVVLGNVPVAQDGSFTVEFEIPRSASPGEAAIKMEGSAFDGACGRSATASCGTYLVPFEILAPG